MTDIKNHGNNASAHLRSIVERVERINDEIKSLKESQKDIFLEAKSAGYNGVALRALIRERAEDPTKRENRELLLDIYRRAIAEWENTPLAQAAMEAVERV
jgi:uncharacterized protein (UPF0335 family)